MRRKRPWLPAGIASFALVRTALAGPAAPTPAVHEEGASTIPTTEVPAWADAAPGEPAAVGSSDGGEHGGVVDDLVDDQYRLGATVEHYVHRVVRLTSSAGVDEMGQIDVDFEPDYEHLRFHRFRVIRSGESADALKNATIRVAAQESDLDERVYKGTMTAHVILQDLRVGDVVDYDYSIEGLNPVLGGRFAERISLAGRRRTSFLRVRVLAPEQRALAFRAAGANVEPAIRTAGGRKELLWERRNVPETVFERDAPKWYWPVPILTLTELSSWSDVAAWAGPLFDRASRPDADIEGAARDIAGKEASPEARALGALRFVQEQVRYLGIEIGANSHEPHAASAVLKQRFGDCKDKSALLLALLHALGIEASPVLVNTRLGEHLDDELPSPYAFNHAIVRIRLDGRDIWVDPTRSAEHGPLGKAPVRYGRALLAAPGTRALTPIDALAPTEPTLSVQETYRVGETDASLDVVRTLRDEHARALRHRISTSSRSELQKHHLDDYTVIYPSIEPQGELAVEDHEAEDVVVLREHYLIHDARKKGRFSVRAASVVHAIGEARTAQRTAPLGIDYPLFVRHEIAIEGLDRATFVDPPDENFHDASLSATVRGEANGDELTLAYEVRTHRDFVPTGEVTAHVALVDSILDACHYSFGKDTAVHKRGRHALTLFSSIGALFGLVGLVAFGRYGVLSFAGWLRSRRHRPRAKESAARPRPSGNGETAATAAAVSSRENAERRLTGVRCSCGARFPTTVAEGAWSSVLFGDEKVHVARILCPACDKAHVRYFIID